MRLSCAARHLPTAHDCSPNCSPGEMARLTIDQIDDPERRIDARNQIAFLKQQQKRLTTSSLALISPKSSIVEISECCITSWHRATRSEVR